MLLSSHSWKNNTVVPICTHLSQVSLSSVSHLLWMNAPHFPHIISTVKGASTTHVCLSPPPLSHYTHSHPTTLSTHTLTLLSVRYLYPSAFLCSSSNSFQAGFCSSLSLHLKHRSRLSNQSPVRSVRLMEGNGFSLILTRTLSPACSICRDRPSKHTHAGARVLSGMRSSISCVCLCVVCLCVLCVSESHYLVQQQFMMRTQASMHTWHTHTHTHMAHTHRVIR